jgi:hypothetical protein
MVAPQPDDDRKDVPEANQKHEGHAGNRRADPRGGGDLGQDDIDITGEPKGQLPTRWTSSTSREDDAMIGGGRHQENHRYGDAVQADRVDQF